MAGDGGIAVLLVIPTKAGIAPAYAFAVTERKTRAIPAFAGMTSRSNVCSAHRVHPNLPVM
jgi:hypothetical protein